jgi:hypothetical protein
MAVVGQAALLWDSRLEADAGDIEEVEPGERKRRPLFSLVATRPCLMGPTPDMVPARLRKLTTAKIF